MTFILIDSMKYVIKYDLFYSNLKKKYSRK